MDTRKKRKILRLRYDQQDGRCYWCDTVMLPPAANASFRGRLPPNAATVEHLVPRGDPRRLSIPAKDEVRIVAACRECNQDYGRYHNQVVLAAGKGA